MVTHFNIGVDDAVAQRARLLKEEIGGTWDEVFEELVATAEAVENAREDDRKALSLVAEELGERNEQLRRERKVAVAEAQAVAGGQQQAESSEPTEDTPTDEEEEESRSSAEASPPPSYAPEEGAGRSLDELIEIGAEEIPGRTSKKEKRVKSLRASLEYLRDNGTARPSDLKSAVYSNGLTGEYESARSWWKNCIYKTFSRIAEETDVIEKPGQNGEWRWTA